MTTLLPRPNHAFVGFGLSLVLFHILPWHGWSLLDVTFHENNDGRIAGPGTSEGNPVGVALYRMISMKYLED